LITSLVPSNSSLYVSNKGKNETITLSEQFKNPIDKEKEIKHTVGTVQKSYRQRERDKIYTLNTHMHDHPLSWLGTDTSI
jgi:hypothetical protein